MREVRSASRAGRKNQIVLAFKFMIDKGYGNEMTSYEIARKIDLRPQSPNFRDILSGLVMDGTLVCRAVGSVVLKGEERQKFVYSLAEAHEPEKRQVKIKKNGKQVGQMELF